MSLRVLQSFPDPRTTTNPYIVMLRKSLEDTPGVEVLTFTWQRAFLSRYDVFHAHWPENLLNGRKRILRRVLFALLLFRWWLTGVALVRTQHNVDRPQGLGATDYWLLKRFERQTALQIVLNPLTPTHGESVLIKHGHYADWYGQLPQPDPTEGRFGYFGLIRRYKNVAELVRTFHELDAPGMTLHVGGKPSSVELANEITSAAAGDQRIRLHLEFLTDADLVNLVGESTLVVLPYSEMHNSGSVLAALSLGRPVLVPDNKANRLLGQEVGEEWVLCYCPPLTPQCLEKAMVGASATVKKGRPDLSERGWDECGSAHLSAYWRAIKVVKGQ